MSLASDWAALVADENARMTDIIAAQPSSLHIGALIASVTREGCLNLSRDVVCSPDEALQLMQWLTETFQ